MQGLAALLWEDVDWARRAPLACKGWPPPPGHTTCAKGHTRLATPCSQGSDCSPSGRRHGGRLPSEPRKLGSPLLEDRLRCPSGSVRLAWCRIEGASPREGYGTHARVGGWAEPSLRQSVERARTAEAPAAFGTPLALSRARKAPAACRQQRRTPARGGIALAAAPCGVMRERINRASGPRRSWP
jgi:hypothetical protein